MTSRISDARRRELERLQPDEMSEADKYDAAFIQYEKDLELYQYETRRWNEVWIAAGKKPPPCPAILPREPERPVGIDCAECDGMGVIERTCECCGGTGDAKPGSKSA